MAPIMKMIATELSILEKLVSQSDMSGSDLQPNGIGSFNIKFVTPALTLKFETIGGT